MLVRIITATKVRDKHIQALMEEYTKRLSPTFSFELVELGGKSEQALQRMFASRAPGDFFVGMDERGKTFDSVGFANWMDDKRQTFRTLNLIIGEAEGLSDTVRQNADALISLSGMTFAYKVCLLVLVEQIYRASTIISGHPYHK